MRPLSLVLALTVALAGPVYAAQLVVNTTADTFDSVCDATDCSLKDAVYVAETNGQADIIELQDGATYLIGTLYSNTLNAVATITTQIDIIGHGATLQRAPSLSVLRFFRIGATGQLSLEGLTLRDALFPGNELGAAIRCDGQLTVDNCHFVNNKLPSGTMGGAIYSNGGSVQLTRSSFIGNQATTGGAFASDGYPALPESVTIDHCSFQGNKALTPAGASGGAIFMRGDTNATIANSTFVGNSSDSAGGAISFHTIPNTYVVDLVNLTIVDNTAYDGGGIYAHTCSDQNCPIVTKPRLTNVILANNIGTLTDPSCGGGFFSVGHNIIGGTNSGCGVTPPTNPPDYYISTLAGVATQKDTGDGGGLYRPLLATSLAVDTGDAALCSPLDQLAFDRQGASCEIGAVEYRACVPPPANLVDWWPFDELAGPAAFDLAGTTNNAGVYQNSPVSTPLAVVPPAHCFDGVNQRMTVPDHAELDFAGDCAQGPAEPFTIDVWVKTYARGVQPIVDKRESAPNFLRGYELFIQDGQLGFELATGTGNSVCGSVGSACADYFAPTVALGGVNLADDRWHYVAVTVSRCPTALGEMYIDGSLAQTFTPLTGDLANAANLLIGDAYPVNVTHPLLHGCLDELEIFKRAFSAAEIATLYDAAWAGKCKPFATTNSPVGTCVNGFHKGVTLVGTAQGKVVRGCVKGGATGTLGGGSAQTCLAADPDGKVAKAMAKTARVETGKCAGVVPVFGPPNAAAVNAAVVGEVLALESDVFGADLDAALALRGVDPVAATCQDAVVKGYQKLLVTKLKIFGACTKKLFKAGSADAATLASCVGDTTQPNSIAVAASQPAGKIAVAAAKFASTIAKQCNGVDVAKYFPSACGSTPPTSLGQCVDARVECRICRMLSHASRLDLDCDVFDDGIANASCAE